MTGISHVLGLVLFTFRLYTMGYSFNMHETHLLLHSTNWQLPRLARKASSVETFGTNWCPSIVGNTD